jgi:hypothetical protein
MQLKSPWTSYSKTNTVKIGSKWTRYSLNFTSNTTDSNARITFYLGNRMPEGGKLYIDSLSMVEDDLLE